MKAPVESFWRIPAPDRSQLRSFGLVMAAVLAIIAALLWYKEMGAATRIVAVVAGLFGCLGLVGPVLLRPIYTVWMLLARVLSFVNTHILLALVFYTLFVGIGLVKRLVSGDSLERQWEPDRSSYWAPRQQTLLEADHYERQF
ncbi:MAG: hypothetical protein GKR89_04590 [Candidatus Latescibacteria bacterium]|nr:hypothetical protein [Candidatus Latescibacterota bacterium]